METIQLLTPITLSSYNGLLNGLVMETGMKVMCGPQHSQDDLGKATTEDKPSRNRVEHSPYCGTLPRVISQPPGVRLNILVHSIMEKMLVLGEVL
jgi:hypothetical protein